ncbi:MAG: hypothetical protein U0Q15_14300 [Kineosporiaceae bacterium]
MTLDLGTDAPVVTRTPQPRSVGGWLSARRGWFLQLAVLAGALGLWYADTRVADLSTARGWGVLGVVSWRYWSALALVAGVIAWQLTRPVIRHARITVAVLALIVVLYAYVNTASSAASLSTSWLHVGFISYISDHGDVAHHFDARFSWPGFFAVSAYLTQVAGLQNATAFLALAPLFYHLVGLGPLWVVGRRVSGDDRLAWFGVVIYFLFNWFSQDYFSPQATALLMSLVILAVLLQRTPTVALTTLRAQVRGLFGAFLQARGGAADHGPRRAVASYAALMFISTALIVAHQLTPLNLIIALAGFAVLGQTPYRYLWLSVGLVFTLWFSFGGVEFWKGNLATILGDIGNLGGNVNVAVGARLQGDPLHEQLQKVRLAWSFCFLALGALGWLRIWRRTDAPLIAVLAFGPFALLGVQSYGGEVAMRCFVFAGPFLAPLAATFLAALVRPAVTAARASGGVRPPAPRALLAGVALWALVAVGGVLLTGTRGANLAFERVSQAQVDAADALFAQMPTDSTIAVLEEVGPLGVGRIKEWDAVSLAPAECPAGIVSCVQSKRPDYIIVTGSQDGLGVLKEDLEPGWTRRATQQVVDAGLYERVFENWDSEILRRTGALS